MHGLVTDDFEENRGLVRRIVNADGSRSVAVRVFCERRDESVPLEECRACPACLAVLATDDGDAVAVRCVRSEEPTARLDRAAPVVAALKASVVCASAELDGRTLAALFAERGSTLVFVVGAAGALAGVVHELDTPGSASAADLASEVRPVLESASVREALVHMARAHLREVPVVTRDGQLVGVLRDIDGLRWIIDHERT